MRRKTVAILSLFLFGASGSSGAEAIKADEPYIVTPEEVADYRSRTGASMNDAISSLEREEMASSEVGALRRSYAERLAGLYWQPYPDHGVIIRLTGTEPVPNRLIQTPAGPVMVTFRTGAPATIKDLTSRLRRAMPKLVEQIPTLRGGWVDEKSGNVILDVGMPEQRSKSALSEAGALRRLLDAEVELRFDRPGLEHIQGLEEQDEHHARRVPIQSMSSAALPQVGGGRQLMGGAAQYCTVGFAVKHAETDVRGIVTAGHCPNDLVYMSYPAANETLPAVVAPVELVSEHWGAENDFQWHTFPSGHPVVGTYCTSRYSCGGVIQSSNSTPEIGRAACHMGQATGRSCGTVTTNEYIFPGRCDNAVTETCPSGNWMRIDGPSLACAAGDSGGPVYSGWTAYGLAKAALYTSPLPGGCQTVIVMPISRLSAAGLKLLH